MEKKDVNDRIGQAWLRYRRGQAEAAASEFREILMSDESSIDAHYGLGLIHRSRGNLAEAVAQFEKCASLVEAALSQENRNDRLEILERMIQQRLGELHRQR